MSGDTSSDAERNPGTAAVPAGELARHQGAEPVTSLDDLARPDLIGSDEELEVLLADLDASRHRDRRPAGGLRAATVADALLVGEIAPSGVIDRPREYAAAGVPYFLRVDLRNRVPALALYELVEGEYRPLAAAAAGTTFVMPEPFEFSVDPADLLDEEAPQV
ncbi:hypothetical protein ACGFJ4_24520 [Micromonospora chalcea]|uniref:hypothetical protein n=1 Tax=Micromonospora chalcea TaxID=1874 RepID=UPI0033E3E275